jgi:hypothetical protein
VPLNRICHVCMSAHCLQGGTGGGAAALVCIAINFDKPTHPGDVLEYLARRLGLADEGGCNCARSAIRIWR